MSIGERLKIARNAVNLSQAALGSIINVGRSQIANIESGSSQLTRGNAMALCQALGIDLEWLWTGKGESPVYNAVKGNKMGNRNVNMAGNNMRVHTNDSDDECREELQKTREELEKLRLKYIDLLEKTRAM